MLREKCVKQVGNAGGGDRESRRGPAAAHDRTARRCCRSGLECNDQLPDTGFAAGFCFQTPVAAITCSQCRRRGCDRVQRRQFRINK